jgi:sialate O-acetylesterase
VWLGSVCNAARRGPGEASSAPAQPVFLLQEPVAYRVYQRDLQGRAQIPLVIVPSQKEASVISAELTGVAPGVCWFADGKFHGVPTGGPYAVNARMKVGGAEQVVSVGPLFVGDLWVLAGQSNMQGYGDLIDVTTPDPRVMSLELDRTWAPAKEPLHWWLLDPARQKIHPKGSGLGLSFAKTVVQRTNVPIGLIPCAVGGTYMTQWDPAKKNEGRRSLYGSMLLQIKNAGGRIKGLLWYQGEAESNEPNLKAYPQVFPALIAAIRADLHQPELPFYLVQIGRFAALNDAARKYWNGVQEVQRRIPERIPHTAVVAAIDLELDDPIHVGTQGLKRAGQRLALVALRELYGYAGATSPNLDKVEQGPDQTLIVKFKGVNVQGRAGAAPGLVGAGDVRSIGLRPARHISGFSIRNTEEVEIVPIFDAAVGTSHDTVVLKLAGEIPKKAQLWYGHGHNPYCNLTDSLDMAVPAFGPIPLDDEPTTKPSSMATAR